MTDDLTARAKAALEDVTDDPMLIHLADASEVVGFLAELLAEVERLQARDNEARRRNGDCPCDHNPDTTQGPEEDCPWHGRTPADLWTQLDIVRKQRDDAQTEVERLRGALESVVSQWRNGLIQGGGYSLKQIEAVLRSDQ